MGHGTGAGCVNCLQKFRAAWWLAERWTGGPRPGEVAESSGGSRRSCNKCHWVVRGKERRTDTGKLDPERKIAGGKDLLLLPRLQVRKHFPTDPSHSTFVLHQSAVRSSLWRGHACTYCTTAFLPTVLVMQQQRVKEPRQLDYALILCANGRAVNYFTETFSTTAPFHWPRFFLPLCPGQACWYRKTNIFFGK